MLYLSLDELCKFYNVESSELTSVLQSEKELGTIFYHDDPLMELGNLNYLAVVLPIMGQILVETTELLPLLPFPVRKVIYEMAKKDEEFLIFTLARYKIAHLKGDFTLNINISAKEFQHTISTILQDYEYKKPYEGKILYWIDLRPELCTLVDSLPINGVDNIVAHGRRIKVLRRTWCE